jgi:nicotinate-nucleotide adenylyltransferase
VIGILGGAFDPPHDGHVALAEAARRELVLDRLVVLVVADPGHREIVADAESRLELARAAFPDTEVRLDHHAFTADAVAGGRFGDAVFVVGADEGAAFPTWSRPDEVLRWVRLAVGTRSGHPRPELGRYGDRVLTFELDSPAVSSSEIRRRVSAGEPIDGLVPDAVADLIRERGLYRREVGLH